MENKTFQEFTQSFKGEVITSPTDSGYKASRLIFNMRPDAIPSMILRCIDVDDVITAVRYAGLNQFPIAVRSGGHGVDGSAMPDGAFVIDMTAMKRISVDELTSTVKVQSGVLLGEMDQATQAYRLVVPAGTVSTTGVAGLTLGGGIGYNMRKFGATVDSLLSCEVVTAAGAVVTANKDENADLFWALKGGGGNFGIVTEFTFQAHKLGPDVVSGIIVFPVQTAKETLSALRNYMADAPRDLFVVGALAPCPPLPMIPLEAHGKPVLALVIVYTGDPLKAEKFVGPLGKLNTPLVNLVGPSTWIKTNQMLDATAPYGMRAKTFGGYLSNLNPESVDVALASALSSPANFTQATVTVQNFWCMGGAISEDFSENSAAFSREGATWLWEAVAMWNEKSDDRIFDSWITDLNNQMRPHLRSNGYINLTTDQGQQWLRGIYGSQEKYERLVETKRKWDPTNMFRFNKNFAL
ncbi:MAG: FAD-binding oxidoreductase [Proteobacteria bacterium]|nr:MAG: FAD-binding oxidoreductase [Pseudomonadota bacterium]